MHIAFVVLIGVLTVSPNLSSAQVAQLPACLHDASERPDQRIRRQEALRTAQQINDAEHRNIARGLVIYRPFKDTTDPCQFAIFSDQSESIYATTPQPRIQILKTRAR